MDGAGSSHQVTRWQLSEITPSLLIKEVLEILSIWWVVGVGVPTWGRGVRSCEHRPQSAGGTIRRSLLPRCAGRVRGSGR